MRAFRVSGGPASFFGFPTLSPQRIDSSARPGRGGRWLLWAPEAGAAWSAVADPPTCEPRTPGPVDGRGSRSTSGWTAGRARHRPEGNWERHYRQRGVEPSSSLRRLVAEIRGHRCRVSTGVQPPCGERMSILARTEAPNSGPRAGQPDRSVEPRLRVAPALAYTACHSTDFGQHQGSLDLAGLSSASSPTLSSRSSPRPSRTSGRYSMPLAPSPRTSSASPST